MQRKYRLRSSIDFKRVRREGKPYAHPLLVLICSPSQQTVTRIGVTASRSVGGAIQRNRAKRRLRAALQPLLPQICPGWDLLLLARPATNLAVFTDLERALCNLLKRAALIGGTDNGTHVN